MSEHLAVYGTMRKGGRFPDRPNLPAETYMGQCRIAGIIHDLGAYPGLVEGAGEVIGDLYELGDGFDYDALDLFEDYEPDDPAASLYLRKKLQLIEPQVEAWVYVYNADASTFPAIESGDWIAHAVGRELL